ncbi:hypothetical protein DSO57_1010162 [Entomophthora muscae]|uniref:Uncharacterized protein n=1 Tax=Entomophthora muscae TaxID=34485 RepID=A0ACC2UFY9_9FUNG|nr:hypothetical protein DSO57_1010162 [Entomophthora muscae]
MAVFIIETLVRATVHEGGWQDHFSSNLNIIDLVLILISGSLELIDLILRLEISELIPLIATVRLVSSLSNISVMYYSKIDKEITKNELLEADILELEYDLDLKDSDNVRLEKELAGRRRKIKRTEDDIHNLATKMTKVQTASWNHLVPTPMVIGMSSLRRKDSKPAQKQLSWSAN